MKKTTFNIAILLVALLVLALSIFYLFFYDKIIQNSIKADTISTVSNKGVPLVNTKEYSDKWANLPDLISLRRLTSPEDGGELMSIYYYSDKMSEIIFLEAITANDYSTFKYYYKHTTEGWLKINGNSIPKNIKTVLDQVAQ